MKTTLFRTLLATMAAVWCSTSAFATVYDMNEYRNDFAFEILSEEDHTAALTAVGSHLHGHVCIPDSVIFRMRKDVFRVTSIGICAFRDNHKVTSVDIPEGVTSIGIYAFWNCDKLESAKLPNTLTEIGDRAFLICESLRSINLPESLTRVGYGVFEGCDELESIVIPKSLTSIGETMFWRCFGLKSVEMLGDVTDIGANAFYGCMNLESIKLPETLTSIGRDAFGGCGLKSVEIPKNVTYIASNIFCYCYYLSSIHVDEDNPVYDSRESCNAVIESKTNRLISGCTSTLIPNSVTCIGDSAFVGSGVTSVKIPNSVTSIGKYAFTNSGLISIEMPNSVTNIGNSAFYLCRHLTSAILPDKLEVLEYDVFNRCNQLKTIHIAEGLTEIGGTAFWNCSSLTSIELPSTLKKIGTAALSSCRNLQNLICHAVEPPVAGDRAFDGIYNDICKLTVPEGSEEAYKAADQWKYFYIPIEGAIGIEGVTAESLVTVYDLQGVMVKRNVRLKDLKNSLPKGIYVVNGKKIVIG